MTIDMYSEKVAEASALIREFAKVDYFHYFARDPESSLEEFIAMLDQAEEKGRQEQAARIAELERQIVEVQAECIKRGADLLERQLAEASAPAVEQQPIGYISNILLAERRKTFEREGAVMYSQPAGAYRTPVFAAPQAADRDKVREAIPDGCALGWNGTIYHGISEIYHQMEEGAALHMVLDEKNVPRADKDGCVYSLVGRVEQYVAASMAAQAPVREVPEGWQLVPKEPTDEMRMACVHNAYYYEIDADWKAMLAAAPLPAAPVQQEGAIPASNKEQA